MSAFIIAISFVFSLGYACLPSVITRRATRTPQESFSFGYVRSSSITRIAALFLGEAVPWLTKQKHPQENLPYDLSVVMGAAFMYMPAPPCFLFRHPWLQKLPVEEVSRSIQLNK